MKNYKQFAVSVTLLKRAAWDMLITVIDKFLGKKKAESTAESIPKIGLQYKY